jgi:hypothetical protein
MLNETLSLLNLLIASNSAEENSAIWETINTSLREQERKLLPLSDLGISCEHAYDAVVSARVASEEGNLRLAIESLTEAVSVLGRGAGESARTQSAR